MAADKPLNILWVSFEDCTPYFGCYGDPVAKTPNLDRLASEGGMWPKAFSTAPVCSPARGAVITGMYPVSIGIHHHRTDCGANYPNRPYRYEAVIPHYVKCFPEYLRAAGYYCTNNAKTDYQFAPPVTTWDECRNTAHWRDRPDSDQPFFAVFNLEATHESGMFEKEGREIKTDPNTVPVPPYFPDTPKVRSSIAQNYDNIAHNDMLLGRFLDQLEEDGLSGNTAVFIWSDHGPMPRGKRWPYDSGVHVPMIVKWPGQIDPGTVSNQLISTVDLAPTILSMVGLPIPAHIQGKAFLGPQAAAPREYVHISRDRYDAMYDMTRAVRDTRFKYIKNYQIENPYLLWNKYRNKHPIAQEMWRCFAEGTLEGDQAVMFQMSRPVEELYDVDADPHELKNLAADSAYTTDLERMRAELKRWTDDVGDWGLMPEDQMFRLMYPDGTQPKTLAPQFVVLGKDAYGTEDLPEGGTFAGPVVLQLQSCTQGASIAYTTEEGDDVKWQLYSAPIRLAKGTTTVRTKAIRIGYAESEEKVATFNVV